MNTIEVTKAKITEELQRESSLLSVNMNDNRGVSMYDRVFVENDALLYGAVTEAVSSVTQEIRDFVSSQTENTTLYRWDLTKNAPDGLDKDVLGYVVCYTMHEWFVKSLNNSGQSDSFASRTAMSLKNILKKLYYKAAPL